jgi:DNA-binding response OmpR family regulator
MFCVSTIPPQEPPVPKRRVLLVDDEVAVLLTMKAVLEISGFDVDTAASAREAKSQLRLHEYQMVITDMRMESDAAGHEVILAARSAPYHPAIALLTAFPGDVDAEAGLADHGADKMLIKPMATAVLLRQIEAMLARHAAKLQRLAGLAGAPAGPAKAGKRPAKSAGAKAAKRPGGSALAGKKAVARKKVSTKKRKR